ncbi:MAG: HlyD family efflux transporter periplasmic adaptor subunit [Phycisphaeraceae bacterium]|nr:HlyD family efflux transporter periplasmic adaptor subunit [Phycisphaeraceae bacterium]
MKSTEHNLSSASRSGMARVAALIGVAVLVIGGGVWLYTSGTFDNGTTSGSSDTPQWAEVRLEPIPITVVAEGDLVAKDQIDIMNLIDHPDDETIESIVEEGTWVKEGDWLYTLNAPGLVSDRDEWISRVREAESELEEARRNLDIEKDTAASAEAKAQLALELAQLSQKQWELGTHRQRVNDLDLAFKKAERELKQASRELDFSKELFEQDFISRTELEQDEISLEEARYAMKTAELDIEVYNKYEKVKQQKEVLSEIEQAEGELERTVRMNENKLKLMEATIVSEENELDQRETRLADLERMVARLEIKAPRDGMVIYASTIGVGWERYRMIREGAGLRGGQRVMVLSNTAQMVANLYVHESRINEVQPGQAVSIRVNARPDEVFTATIIGKKNSAVQTGNANPHLRQYQVLAEMPPELGDDIRPGMNCSGEIRIREITEALAVPIQAVHTVGAEHFVYVPAEDGKIRRQAIEMGGASDTLVQVKSGIEAGARVLLRTPRPGELLLEETAPQTVPAAGKPAQTTGAI